MNSSVCAPTSSHVCLCTQVFSSRVYSGCRAPRSKSTTLKMHLNEVSPSAGGHLLARLIGKLRFCSPPKPQSPPSGCRSANKKRPCVRRGDDRVSRSDFNPRKERNSATHAVHMDDGEMCDECVWSLRRWGSTGGRPDGPGHQLGGRSPETLLQGPGKPAVPQGAIPGFHIHDQWVRPQGDGS